MTSPNKALVPICQGKHTRLGVENSRLKPMCCGDNHLIFIVMNEVKTVALTVATVEERSLAFALKSDIDKFPIGVRVDGTVIGSGLLKKRDGSPVLTEGKEPLLALSLEVAGYPEPQEIVCANLNVIRTHELGSAVSFIPGLSKSGSTISTKWTIG